MKCEECLELCMKRKDGPPPYCCKSVVYDSQWKFCDLFAIQARTQADFVRYPGRVYFSPIGNCTAQGAGTTASPGEVTGGPGAGAIVDCPAGQKAVLSIFQNATNPNLAGTTPISADSSEKCGLLCVQNKDDKGNPFQCNAAAFSKGQCVFSSQPPAENTAQTLKPGADPNDLYLEKKCYPVDKAGTCTAIVLDPHHLIVGYNRKTVDASSYDQCLQQCLTAKQQFQFTCNSGQYYADATTENCILNEETRETKPDVYLSTDDNNIYFEPQCGDGTRLIYSMKRSKALRSLRDLSITEPTRDVRWSDWSECNKTTNTKHRYENCLSKRHTDCRKQEVSCDYVDKYSLMQKKINEEFPCEPIIVDNKPNCDYGVRKDPLKGTREYGCKPNTAECWNNELIFS